jgi:cellulose synthase operon protein C
VRLALGRAAVALALAVGLHGQTPRPAAPAAARPAAPAARPAAPAKPAGPPATLEHAESLWKARDYKGANAVFIDLVAQNPTNAAYRVRWGRLMLENSNPADAADLFKEAIEIDKNSAGAYLGLALIAAENFEAQAAEFASKAVSLDPKLLEAQELLATVAVEDNDDAKAAEEANKALKIDPNSAGGKAVLATLELFAGKKETSWDPKDARGYETMGRLFVVNRRYTEGIAYFRKALELDPRRPSAHTQLGINLMRIGQEEEARRELETAFNTGPKSTPTENSLALLDTLAKFETSTSPRVVLKMDRKEAALLQPYFQAEAERAIATYEKKYGFKLTRPVRIEVYPNHEDFAVRALGLPGLGALGVTFNYSIAMDSPSGRAPGEFHWASTLWHEMSHVFTLAMTDSHVPRWLTEGIAVHEETAVSPEWGDRLTPDVIAAIKNKTLLPIAELDRGFIHPKSPIQVGVSYFQGGRICDYIAGKFGWPTVLAMLHDFAGDMDTAAVVRKELKIEPEEFDKRFIASVEADTKKTVENFDAWKKQIKEVNEAYKAKNYDAVIKEGLAIRDLYPDYVEAGSVYEFVARSYLAKDDKAAAARELERYMRAGGRDPELLKILAARLTEEGRKKEAAEALERLNVIYPMDNQQHASLGALLLDQGDFKGAIREFAAVVAHKPIDPAEAHYQLARGYYLDRQTDKAQDELLVALEAAPSYRPAQKLLLELSGAEKAGTPGDPVKKE